MDTIFLTDLQPLVPKFIFSPVVSQNSRNNQDFQARALQDVEQHPASEDTREEVGKLVCAPVKLLIKSHNLHLHRCPGEITGPVSVILSHQTEM